MKYLSLDIENCSKCPYGQNTRDECLHPESPGMTTIRYLYIPDWCPLPNKETLNENIESPRFETATEQFAPDKRKE